MDMSEDEHAALVEGVQPWMREDIKLWLAKAISIRVGAGVSVNHELIRDFDRRAKSTDPLAGNLKSGPNSFERRLYENPDLYVRMLDFLVWSAVQADPQSTLPAELEVALKAGSSTWKVGTREGFPGLEKRVPQGVQDAADAAMAAPGDAGRLLSEAWHAIYGVNPQPDLGYRKAIEAVEAVVLPAVVPGDDTATLSKALGQMRADKDWKLPFVKEHIQNPSQGVVLGMMQALWSGHSDRHPGTASYTPSTPEAAEAAVSLAVTLVNWFSAGAVQRRP